MNELNYRGLSIFFRMLLSRRGILFHLISALLFLMILPGYSQNQTYPVSKTAGSPGLNENQILYNGKVWRNLYYRIKGDQFLFSPEPMPGRITMSGHTYGYLELCYDIFNDEILTPTNNGIILQLNKEMVDSFMVSYLDRDYRFINVHTDSIRYFNGYLNLLYRGKSDLCLKYMKEVQLLAVERKYDLFYESRRLFFVTGGKVFPLNNAGDIYKAVPEYKDQLKAFSKKNRLRMSKKEPDSFIPLIRYYDSLIN
jgi:hypothetical protein